MTREEKLEYIRAEVARLDRATGQNVRETVEISIFSGTQRLGSYSFRIKSKQVFDEKISISEHLFECEADVLDTIRHEYAHCLVTRRYRQDCGHDARWKSACVEVGCNPKSTNRTSNSVQEAIVKDAKYVLKCSACGQKFPYKRKGKHYRMVEQGCDRVICGCGGKLIIEK